MLDQQNSFEVFEPAHLDKVAEVVGTAVAVVVAAATVVLATAVDVACTIAVVAVDSFDQPVVADLPVAD